MLLRVRLWLEPLLLPAARLTPLGGDLVNLAQVLLVGSMLQRRHLIHELNRRLPLLHVGPSKSGRPLLLTQDEVLWGCLLAVVTALPQCLRTALPAIIVAWVASSVYRLLLPRRLLSRGSIGHAKAVADGRGADHLVDMRRAIRHAAAKACLLSCRHPGLRRDRDVDLHDARRSLDVCQAALQGREVQVVFVSTDQGAQWATLAFLRAFLGGVALVLGWVRRRSYDPGLEEAPVAEVVVLWEKVLPVDGPDVLVLE